MNNGKRITFTWRICYEHIHKDMKKKKLKKLLNYKISVQIERIYVTGSTIMRNK